MTEINVTKTSSGNERHAMDKAMEWALATGQTADMHGFHATYLYLLSLLEKTEAPE